MPSARPSASALISSCSFSVDGLLSAIQKLSTVIGTTAVFSFRERECTPCLITAMVRFAGYVYSG